jgi:hypothetical protein
MLAKHQQLGITDAQRFRFASLMGLAADDTGMPADPESVPPSWPTLNGNADSARELATRRKARRACAGPPMGLG